MKDTIHKLKAHVDALEDLTLRAFNRYLFLKPMLTSEPLIARINGENNSDYFERLRGWLYWGLVQELAKICRDKDQKSPSVSAIQRKLVEVPGLLTALEEKYIANPNGIGSEIERRSDFKLTYREFDRKATELLESNAVSGYKTIRDKLISHNELRKQKTDYEFHQVQENRLKYGDERVVLETLEELTRALLLLVSNVDTNWDSYLSSTESLTRRFWHIEASR